MHWFVILLLVRAVFSYSHSPDENQGIDDPNLFEGDMILTPKQRYRAEHGKPVFGSNRRKRGTSTFTLWPLGELVYEIDSSLAGSSTAMDAIKAGMDEWTSKTCIRFKKRTNEPSYVRFQDGSGCSSNVGRTGTQQPINLATGCRIKGIVAHEIGHALGLFHEQSRPDRDSFVRIETQNIREGRENNFLKYDNGFINSLGSPYDYGSVMHYGDKFFSKNGLPTIVVLTPGAEIGQRNGLSPTDAQQANLLYQAQCDARPTTAVPSTAPPPSPTTDLNECLSSPCDPNAVCQNTIGSFTCTCKPGFTGNGLSCTDINECTTSSPCDEPASCTNTEGSFLCTCPNGFVITGNGLSCSDVNECISLPCDPNAFCLNLLGSFTCTCNPGYTGNGQSCTDINECMSSPCDPNAACQNTMGSFTCACNPGYTGNGLSCTDINECMNSPCSASAVCQNTAGSFSCTCQAGFTGNGLITCLDINECLSPFCDVNAACLNTFGSVICICNPGFNGDGRTCTAITVPTTPPTTVPTTAPVPTTVDIDECLSSPCDANAICQNTIGSFTCTCIAGFTGDGLSCTALPTSTMPTTAPVPTTVDIDECLSSPCDANAICQNTIGSFTCTCIAGFTGDGLSCTALPTSTMPTTAPVPTTDINECLSSPCDANAICQNTIASFTCTCSAGFTGDGFTCFALPTTTMPTTAPVPTTDIDECLSSPCDANAVCQNTIGSFTCTCNAGFTGDGLSCTDVNECSTSSPCGVNGACLNLFGSFLCICFPGFNSHGRNCTDINECLSSPCDANANCQNTIGSFQCSCNAGFTGDGITCSAVPTTPPTTVPTTAPVPTTDINECLSSPCDANAVCQNTIGSFTCTCIAGFTGDGLSCTALPTTTVPTTAPVPTTDMDECLSSPCDANAICQNTIGSFTCTCNAGFTGDGLSCTDINECMNSPCSTFAVCQNTVGSFSCTCNAGFTGNGLSCLDVNECSTSSPCGVNGACLNLFGSFLCICFPGFNTDGRNCTDINECLSSPCDVNANCQNTMGSFQCSCNAGFTGDGITCSVPSTAPPPPTTAICQDIASSCAQLSFVWCSSAPSSCLRTCNRCPA